MSEHARMLVNSLIDGQSIPDGYYRFLLGMLRPQDARLIDWFVESEGGRTFITEEAYVGLLDRIGE